MTEHALTLASADPIEVPPGPPPFVKLMPAGKVTPRDGRGPWFVEPVTVVQNSLAYLRGSDAVIDFDHQTDVALPKGGTAPAAGWIKELIARPDGVYGRVEWNGDGAAALTGRRYRYLSPAFNHDAKGRVVRVIRASLVNAPALELPALAHQETPRMTERSDAPDAMARLRSLLALPEGTGPDAVFAAVENRLALASATGIDPAQAVPVDVTMALAKQLQSTIHQHAAEKAERMVGDAVKSGQLPPALRPWALALCTSQPKAFEEFVAGMPPLIQPGRLVPTCPPGSKIDGSAEVALAAAARKVQADAAAQGITISAAEAVLRASKGV